MRQVLVAALTGAFMLMSAATAVATITVTQHFTSNVPPPDIIPISCSPAGNAISLVATGNGVLHFTQNNAGDFWITGTFEGDGTVTTGMLSAAGFKPTGPVYSGHMQEWFGHEDNNQNAVSHATFNFNGNDTVSGAAIGIHAAFDVTMNANGVITVSNFTVSCR